MKTWVTRTQSLEETHALGARLAQVLAGGMTVALCGELGAGKTTLVSSVVAHLPGGERARVKSPTYSVAHTYPTQPRVWHMDLYRLHDAVEVEQLGILEQVLPGDLTFMEWAEHAPPEGTVILVDIVVSGETQREWRFSAHGAQAEAALESLAQ